MNELFALIAVILVDVALSLDNAVMISVVAESVPEEQRSRAKLYGIGGAVVARLLFALVASWLLKFTLFTLAGGAYLVKVAWDMRHRNEPKSDGAPSSLFGPVVRIMLADVVMSLDNVLAVAHNAREHTAIMLFGLVLSITLMFFATKLISLMIEREPRLYYLAVGIVALTGVHMVWHGAFTLV